MSLTQTTPGVTVNIMTHTNRHVFSYDDIYADDMPFFPYHRLEGNSGAHVAAAIMGCHITIANNMSTSAMKTIINQVTIHINDHGRYFDRAAMQGNYQRYLVDEARDILDELIKPQHWTGQRIGDIYRQIEIWLTRHNERHTSTINVLNDRSARSLSLVQRNDPRPLNVLPALTSLGAAAIAFGIARAKDGIYDLTNAAVITVIVISQNYGADIKRVIVNTVSKVYNGNSLVSANCLGSLLSIGSNPNIPIIYLNNLNLQSRSYKQYQIPIYRNLKREVGIDFRSGSNIVHIEPVKENTSYDYQGPLYRFMHWAIEAPNVIFEGNDDIYSNMDITEIDDDGDYLDSMKLLSSRQWQDNLTLQELGNYVYAIINEFKIDPLDPRKVPDIDMGHLHVYLQHASFDDKFPHRDYRHLTMRVIRQGIGSSAMHNKHIDDYMKNPLSGDHKRVYENILYELIDTMMLSRSKDPDLIQNVIVTYNNTVFQFPKIHTVDGYYNSEYGSIVKQANDEHILDIWKIDSTSYSQISAQLKSTMKIDMPAYDYGSRTCTLDWNSVYIPTKRGPYSSVEMFWHGYHLRFESLSQLGAKSILALNIPDFDKGNKMAIVVAMKIYKTKDQWSKNTIERIDIPRFPEDTIIKYDDHNALIYEGRLGTILSTNKWIVLIPFG